MTTKNSLPSARASRPALALLAAISALAPAPLALADGPGVGNVAYAATDLYKTLSAIDASNGAPLGHGFVAMHRGYLVVICAQDSGGGQGTGSLAVYDISNPASPVNVFTTINNPNYTISGSNYAGNIREAHSVAFWGDYMAVTSTSKLNDTTDPDENGIQIWDMSNLDKPAGVAANAWTGPTKVASLNIPGLTGSDYSDAPWSLAWTGRYLYVGVTNDGLAIVDTNTITAPVLANRGAGKPNPVPNSQVGGTKNGNHQIVAFGNSIVQGRNNFTTVNIADPLNPVLLDEDAVKTGYSAQRYGDKGFGFGGESGGDKLNTFNISNLSAIDKLSQTSLPSVDGQALSGGYGVVQDGILYFGGGKRAIRTDITGNPPYTLALINPVRPAGRETDWNLFRNVDWDFVTPLGNIGFVASDHEWGSAIVVLKTAKDTTGPNVVAVSPKNNATSVPVTSVIGLQFADMVDGRTLNSTNITIRKQGTTTDLPGRYVNNALGIVNFDPTNDLEGNSTYEVIVKADGIKDYAGNPTTTAFTSTFSTGTGGTNPTPLTADLATEAAVTTGTSVTFDVTTTGGSGTVDVLWNFGDGTTSDTNTATTVSKTYANPGNYNVTVTVTRGTETATDSLSLTVHNPLTTGKPTNTSTIIYDDATTDKVWAVNTDAGTLAAINPTNGNKLHEVASGSKPRTLAKAPDGSIWVANEGSDNITVHSASNGSLSHTIALPRGSAPFGILFSPDGTSAYVSLGGSWEVAKINPSTRVVSTPVWVGAHPRGMAMTGDSSRLFITRFLSTGNSGSIYEVNPSTLDAVRTLSLAKDTTADSEDTGRGVPNFLISPVISPDGTALAIPSTKVNIDRGTARDGVELDFDNTVRTITSFVDLANNTEFADRRIDLNDRDSAIAGTYSPLGNYLFVVTQGGNSLEVINAYTGDLIVSYLEMGLAPRGITLNPDGTRAYIQTFMDRSIKVLNISAITQNNLSDISTVATTKVVATEPLSATVLKGKQIFYNAADPRMSQDRYLSCATCHTDAGHDGVVWDFTNRGEGFRNTIDLNGRSGMGHGLVHWSANFDEIQDFENDIRNHQGGDGFMTDADFNATSDPLGAAKAGKSTDLDALAAYVASLDTVGKSPFRDEDGTLSAAGEAGKAVFDAQGCATCHIPELDYRDGLSHDVGTLKTTSGKRLGATLTGIDTPTLIGLWNSAPYLHDGSAADLQATFVGNHGGSLTTAQKNSIVDFLLEIEDGVAVEPPPPTGDGFVQANGLLVMEAENATSIQDGTDPDWVQVTVTDASGGAAMSTPNTPSATTTYTTSASSALVFDAEFTSSGNHYLWVRARGLAAGGADDSVNYSLNNGTLVRLNTANSTTWTWTKASAAINIPSAATQTLRIHVRENGTQIDKVLLTTDNAYTPTGEGPAETLGEAAAPVPAIPTGVSATATSSTAVTVNYTDASTDETGFDIEYKLASATTWAAATDGTASTGSGNAKTASLTGLTASSNYDIRVAAYNANGSSAWATTTVSTPAAPPPTGGNTVTIENNATSGVSFSGSWYALSIGGASGGTLHTIANVSTANATVTPGLSGSYFVEVYSPTAWSRLTTGLAVTVNHSGGASPFTVNQQTGAGQWTRLGTAALTLTTTSTVVINGAAAQDVDTPTEVVEYPAFDAVRFVPAN